MSEHRSGSPSLLESNGPVLALYGVSTLVLTFPLAFQLGTHIPLGAGDLWHNLWNFWWWKTALLELHATPYWTDMLFHPDGVSLASHTHSPLNMLATLPLAAVFGPEIAYNVAILAGFWLAAFSMYLLLRDITGEPRAAFLAGLLFAFSPMHFEQSLEHLNLASIQFLPLFVFFLRRLLRAGGAKNRVGTALSFTANALVCWMYGFVAALIAIAVAARELVSARRAQSPGVVIRNGVFAAALAAVLILPFAWPMLSDWLGPEGGPVKPFEPYRERGADPAFWLLPSDHHPVLGALTTPLYAAHRSYLNAGFLCYLGWLPLGLAVRSLASRHSCGDRRGFWGAWVAIFLVLSLGSQLTLFGQQFPELTLPHAFFEGVPLFRLLRVANRFGVFALLGILVLAGSSLAALFRNGRTRLAWTLGAIAVFEYLWLPFPVQPSPLHPYLEQLAGDPDAGAVLPIPLPVSAVYSEAMYDQTVHGRPIVGGYAGHHILDGRGPLRSVATSRFLRGVALLRPRAADLSREEFEALGIGSVVVHRDATQRGVAARRGTPGMGPYERRALELKVGFPDFRLERVVTVLRRRLGPPLFEDERLLVFRVLGASEPGR